MKKEAEEGQMEVEKLCWGLIYNTEDETVSMPEPKIEKANYILADPGLDYGNQQVPMKLLEQYRGNQQYWALVMPAMRHLLGATDAMMRGGTRNGLANPGTCEKTRSLIFEDFWTATELTRILVAGKTKWKARFVGSMAGVLSISERLGPRSADEGGMGDGRRHS